jgi:hypothetical protein
LKTICGSTLYSRRRNYQDSPLSPFPAKTISFDASLGYKNSSRRNLASYGNGCIFLEEIWRRLASYS